MIDGNNLRATVLFVFWLSATAGALLSLCVVVAEDKSSKHFAAHLSLLFRLTGAWLYRPQIICHRRVTSRQHSVRTHESVKCERATTHAHESRCRVFSPSSPV